MSKVIKEFIRLIEILIVLIGLFVLFVSFYIQDSSVFTQKSFLEKGLLAETIVKPSEIPIYESTKGVPQGEWCVNNETFSTKDLIDKIEVGSNWGAIPNISEQGKNRIKSLEQYMGYTEHCTNLNADCFYQKASIKLMNESRYHAPYYHQGLFGKEEWGNIASGSNLLYPDKGSTFNSDGCHLYTMSYALSVVKKRVINPPETLVLGWYAGFWNMGMGNTENIKGLREYLGIDACAMSDDLENGKKEVDNVLDNNGVVIIYVGKPFSFGNYHWVCITDRVNDNGVDKYRIWTSTNIRQAFQLYTFDYLYSKRVMSDWIRIGIMP